MLDNSTAHKAYCCNYAITHCGSEMLYAPKVDLQQHAIRCGIAFVHELIVSFFVLALSQVRRIVFEASYLVLGLGDVYLGAPCAVPVNPLHRLVTTKMNPARTFTHEGTVGIGGSYMCIYPMDSPGGYQLIGRTLPIWNTFATAGPFSRDKPWLLEFFDQVN